MAKTEYACGFAFDGADGYDRVALIEKRRPSWQAGLLNGIGGHVEPGEAPLEAMVREFYEETGQATARADWREFAVVETDKSVVHMFAARLDAIRCATVTDERVLAVRVGDLHDWATLPNLSWLVPMAQRADDLLEPVRIRERARYET